VPSLPDDLPHAALGFFGQLIFGDTALVIQSGTGQVQLETEHVQAFALMQVNQVIFQTLQGGRDDGGFNPGLPCGDFQFR
jgi:hypothetical protein